MRFAFGPALLGLTLSVDAAAQDWSTHRHDQARSGRVDAALDAGLLAPAWTHAAALAPRPAWPGPARWDAFAGLAGLKSMRNYDPVFHPIAVGDAVWYPSSAEDAVVCLDARTGAERWRFRSEGPVRIAPTFVDGRLYFGSDDGGAYCVDATTGAEVWHYDPTEGTKLVLNDGKLISRWPVRSGVAVEGDTAYFTASLVPWNSSYVCAVDAATGAPRYVKDLGTGYTLEGALALSSTLLVAPQGRVAPLRFERETGQALGSFEGGGGSFCLVTDEDRVLHGPGNKTGWITDSGTGGQKIASFEKGNAVVLGGEDVYLLMDDNLGCLDRTTGLVRWSVPHQAPYTMILVGDTLLLGGDGRVEARRAEDGRLLWIGEVPGRAFGLAFAQGRLLASTDEGVIAAFSEGDERYVVPAEEAAIAPILADARAIEEVRDRELLDRFVLQANGLGEDGSFRNLGAEDRLGATPQGPLELVQIGELHAVRLDGRSQDLAITSDLAAAALPTKELSVTAWVRVDAPTEWGGILGASQDNGSFEKGWLLGYRKDRLAFALNGTEGPDKLTWLVAPTAYTKRGWHHVAATYDGKRMRLYVDGEKLAETEEQGGAIAYPEWAYYHAGAYRDQDEYFRMTGMLHELRVYGDVLTEREVAAQAKEKAGSFPEPEVLADATPAAAEPTLVLERGPELRFDPPKTFFGRHASSGGMASVIWHAPAGGATQVEVVDPEGEVLVFEARGDGRRHKALLTGLRPNTLYRYRVLQDGKASAEYECDTHFDFARDPGLHRPVDDDDLEWQSAVGLAGSMPSQVLIVGADEKFAMQMLRSYWRSNVTVVTTDRAAAVALRSEIGGGRGSVLLLPDGDESVPLPNGWADVVLVSSRVDGVEDLLERGVLECVRPYGGVAILPAVFERYAPAVQGLQPRGTQDFPYPHHVRGAPEGAGEWSHMYGTPAGAAYGGEDLGGARTTSDLELTWLGRPGPRYQTDRQNRKPAPLSINGRLFLQGLHRVICMDAHNGSILWGLELPELARFNIPRSSANWCADEEHLYLAMRNRAHVIDAATGDTARVLEIEEDEREWGYLASAGDLILGSAVREGGHHTRWWGSASWYDAKGGDDAAKIVSEELFAISKETGRRRWTYSNGRIIDATIVQHGDAVWFVEARDDATRAIERGRVHEASLWDDLHLVCLDLRRGKVRWERPAKPMPGTVSFYLLYGEGKLAMCSSEAGAEGTPGGGTFALYAFDAESGESLWRKKFAWEADHHGKHLSRPAIVGGEIVVRPKVFDLETGDEVNRPFPEGHQCGTYAASTHALFLRAGELCVWDREAGGGTRWSRLRPDCWISTIPACGMLLSPEGGGGCSCGSWLEASMGFAPKLPE